MEVIIENQQAIIVHTGMCVAVKVVVHSCTTQYEHQCQKRTQEVYVSGKATTCVVHIPYLPMATSTRKRAIPYFQSGENFLGNRTQLSTALSIPAIGEEDVDSRAIF